LYEIHDWQFFCDAKIWWKLVLALHTLSAVILQSMDVWWFMLMDLSTLSMKKVNDHQGVIARIFHQKKWKPQPRTYTHTQYCYLIFNSHGCHVSSFFLHPSIKTANRPTTHMFGQLEEPIIQIFETKNGAPQISPNF